MSGRGERGNRSGCGESGHRSGRGESGNRSRGRGVQKPYHQPRFHRERTDQFHDNRSHHYQDDVTDSYHGNVNESYHAAETEHYHDDSVESYHVAGTEHFHGETLDRYHGDTTEPYHVAETEHYHAAETEHHYGDSAENYYVDETEHYQGDSAETYHDTGTETYNADNADPYSVDENNYYQSDEIDNYHSERPHVTHGNRTHSDIIPEPVYSESEGVYDEEYIHHHDDQSSRRPPSHTGRRGERRERSHERRPLLDAPDNTDRSNEYREHDTQMKERRTLLDDRGLTSVPHAGQSQRPGHRPRRTLLGDREEEYAVNEPDGHYSDIVDSAHEQFVDPRENYEVVSEYSIHVNPVDSQLNDFSDDGRKLHRLETQNVHSMKPQQYSHGRGQSSLGQFLCGRGKPIRVQHPSERGQSTGGQHTGERVEHPRGQHLSERVEPTRGQHPDERGKPSRGQHLGERGQSTRGQHTGERVEDPRGQHLSERVEPTRGQHPDERGKPSRGQHLGERGQSTRGQHTGERVEDPRGQHLSERVEPTRGQHPDERGKPSRGQHLGERGQSTRGQHPGERVEHPRGQHPSQRGKSSRGQHPNERGKPSRGQHPSERGKPSRGQHPGERGEQPRGQHPGERGELPRGQHPSERGELPRGQHPSERGEQPRGQHPGERGEHPRGQHPGERGEHPRGQHPGDRGELPRGQHPGERSEHPRGQCPGTRGEHPKGQHPPERGKRPRDQYPPEKRKPTRGADELKMSKRMDYAEGQRHATMPERVDHVHIPHPHYLQHHKTISHHHRPSSQRHKLAIKEEPNSDFEERSRKHSTGRQIHQKEYDTGKSGKVLLPTPCENPVYLHDVESSEQNTRTGLLLTPTASPTISHNITDDSVQYDVPFQTGFMNVDDPELASHIERPPGNQSRHIHAKMKSDISTGLLLTPDQPFITSPMYNGSSKCLEERCETFNESPWDNVVVKREITDEPCLTNVPFQTCILDANHPRHSAESVTHIQKPTGNRGRNIHPKMKSRVSRGLLPTPEIQTDILPPHTNEDVATRRVHERLNDFNESVCDDVEADRNQSDVPFETGLMNVTHPRWTTGPVTHARHSVADTRQAVDNRSCVSTSLLPTPRIPPDITSPVSTCEDNSRILPDNRSSSVQHQDGDSLAEREVRDKTDHFVPFESGLMNLNHPRWAEWSASSDYWERFKDGFTSHQDKSFDDLLRSVPDVTASDTEHHLKVALNEMSREDAAVLIAGTDAGASNSSATGQVQEDNLAQMVQQYKLHVELTKALEGMQKTMQTLNEKIRKTPKTKAPKTKKKTHHTEQELHPPESNEEITETYEPSKVDNSHKQEDNESSVAKQKDNEALVVEQKENDASVVEQKDNDDSVDDVPEQDIDGPHVEVEENPEQVSDHNDKLSVEVQEDEEPGPSEEQSTIPGICEDANVKSGKYKSENHISDTAGEHFGLGSQTEYKTYREWRLAKQRMDRYFSSDNDSAKEFERDGRQASGYDKHRRNDKMPESSRRTDHRNSSGERRYGSSYQRNDSERRLSNDQFPGQRNDTYSEDYDSGRRNQRSSSRNSDESDNWAKRKDNATIKSPNYREDYSKQHQPSRTTERPYHSSSVRSPEYQKNQDRYGSEKKKWEHYKNAPNRSKSPEQQTKHQSSYKSGRGSDHHKPNPKRNYNPEDQSRNIDRQISKHTKSPEQHKVSQYREKHVPGPEHESRNQNFAELSEIDTNNKEDKLADSDEGDHPKVEEDNREENLFMKFSVNTVSDDESQTKAKVIKDKTSDKNNVQDNKNVTLKLFDIMKGKSGQQQQETKHLDASNQASKIIPHASKSNVLPTSKSSNPDRENIFEKLSETLSSSSTLISNKNVTSKKEEKTHSNFVRNDSSSDDSEDVFEKINSMLTKDKRKQKTFTVGPNKSHVKTSSISKNCNTKSYKETPAPVLIVTDSNTSISDSDDKLKLASAQTNTKKKEFVKYLRRVNKTLFWKNHELKPLEIRLQRLSKDDIYKLKKKVRKETQLDCLKSLATKVSSNVSTPKGSSQGSKEQKSTSVCSGKEKREHVSGMKQKIKLPDNYETMSKPVSHKQHDTSKHVKHKEQDISKHVYHKEQDTSKSLYTKEHSTTKPSSHKEQDTSKPVSHKDQYISSPVHYKKQETTLPVCEVSVQIVSDEDEESNMSPDSEGSEPSTTESKQKSDCDKNIRSEKYRRIIVPIPSASENSESDIERTVLVSQHGRVSPVISDSEDSEEFEGSLGSEEDASPCADDVVVDETDTACDRHSESESTEIDDKITTNINTGNVERGNSAICDKHEDILSEGTSGRNVVSIGAVDHERRIKPNKAKSLFKSPAKSRTFPQLDGHSDPLYEISGESSGDEGDVEDNSDDDIYASQDLFADIDDRNKYLITPGISSKAPCLSKNDKDGVFDKVDKHRSTDDQDMSVSPKKNTVTFFTKSQKVVEADDSTNEESGTPTEEENEGTAPVKDEPSWLLHGYTQEPDTIFLSDDDEMTMSYSQPVILVSDEDSEDEIPIVTGIKKVKKETFDDQATQQLFGDSSSSSEDWSDKGSDFEPDSLFRNFMEISKCNKNINSDQRSISNDSNVTTEEEEEGHLSKEVKKESDSEAGIDFESSDEAVMSVNEDFLSIPKKIKRTLSDDMIKKSAACIFNSDDDELLATCADSIEKKLGKKLAVSTSVTADIKASTELNTSGTGLIKDENYSSNEHSSDSHHKMAINVRKTSNESTGSSYSQYEEMTPMTPYIQDTQVDPDVKQSKSSKNGSVFDFHSEHFSDISDNTANVDKNPDEWSDDSDIMILDHSFDTEHRKNDADNIGQESNSLYDAVTQVGNLNTSVSASDLDKDDEMYEAMTQIDALELRLKKRFEERLNTAVDDISEAEDVEESGEENDIYEQQTQVGPSAEDVSLEKGSKDYVNGEYDIQTQVVKPCPYIEDISDFDESGKSSVVDEFEAQTQVDTAGHSNADISAVFEDITDEDSETQPYDDPQLTDYFQQTQADAGIGKIAAVNSLLGVKYDHFSPDDTDTPDEDVYNVATQVDEHNVSTSTIENEDYNETTLVDDSSVLLMNEYNASTQDDNSDDDGDDDDELPDIESDTDTQPYRDPSVDNPFVAATQIDIQNKPLIGLKNKLLTGRLARNEGYGKTYKHNNVASFIPHDQDKEESSDDNMDIYQFATQIDVIEEVEKNSIRNKRNSLADKSRVTVGNDEDNDEDNDDFNAATQVDMGSPEIENDADCFYMATQIDDFDAATEVNTASPEIENDADCFNMATQIDEVINLDTSINSPEIKNNADCFNMATQVDEVINLDTSSSADNEVADKPESASPVKLPVSKANESLSSVVKHTMERESSVPKTDVAVRSVLKRPNPDAVSKTVTFGHYGDVPVNKKPRIAPESTRQILPTVPQRMKTIKEKRNSGVRITSGSSKSVVPVPSSEYDSPFEIDIIDATSTDMWLSKRIQHPTRVLDKGKESRVGKRKRKEDPMLSLKAKMQAARSQLRERSMHTVSQPEAASKRMKKTMPDPSTELDDVTLPTDSQIVGQGLPILNPVGLLKKGHKSGASHHGEPSHINKHCVVSTSSSSVSSTTITLSTSTSTSVITSSATSSTCRSSTSVQVPCSFNTNHKTSTSSVDKTQKIVEKTNDNKVSKSANSRERIPNSDKSDKTVDNVNGGKDSKSSERRPSSDKRERSYDKSGGGKESKSGERRPSREKREKSVDNSSESSKEYKSTKSGEKRPSSDRREKTADNVSERNESKKSKSGERKPSSDKREASVETVNKERESKSDKSKDRRPSCDKRDKTVEKVDERKVHSANTADTGQDRSTKHNENSDVEHVKKVNDKGGHSSSSSHRSDKENRERSRQKSTEERSNKENKERNRKAQKSTEDRSHRSQDDKQRSDKTKTSSRTSDSSKPRQDSRNTVNNSKSVTMTTDCSSTTVNIPQLASSSSRVRINDTATPCCSTMTTESIPSRPSENSTSHSVNSASFKPTSNYCSNKTKDLTRVIPASSGSMTVSVAMSINTTVCTNSRTTVTMSAASTRMSVVPSTSTHIQSSVLLQKPRKQVASTSVSSHPAVTATTSRQPFQTIPSNVLPVAMETLPYNMVDKSTPLQWHDFLKVLLRWNPLWLQEKEHFERNNQRVPTPPITNDLCGHNNHTLYPLVPRYENYKEYSEKFMLPLLLHETWESCYSTWRQNKTHKQLIEHEVCYSHRTPPKNELTTYTLLGVISEQDRWKRRFVSEGELVKICAPGVEKISETKTKETKRDMMGYVDAIIFKDASVNRIVSHFKCLGERWKGMRDCVSIKILVTVRNRAFEPSPTEIIHIQSISPIVNTYRQYTGLSSLPRSPLCQSLLYPTNNMIYCDKAPAMVQNQEDKMYNESQSVAINTAVRVCGLPPEVPRVCLLQGPPGTGKSHTIVGIVREILKVRKGPYRICLCAQSNAAVDELLRRLIYRDTAKKKSNMNIVRLGKPTSVHKEIQDICLDKLVDKNLKRVRKEKILQKLPKSLQTGILSVKYQISALKNDLKSASELQSQKLMIDLKAKEKELERLESKCQVPQHTPIDRAEEGKMRRDLLLKAQVVAGTLSSIGLEIIRSCFQGIKQAFHVAIIDEATQAIELETLIPLQYGVSKLILVGDPQQLPPTVVSQVAADHKLNLSLFERLDSHFRSTQINPVILLDTQYRMNPEIAVFPNKYVYSGKLKNDRSVMEKRKCNLAPYIVFNLSEGREFFSQGTRSMSNDLEAEFTAELCEMIVSEKTFRAREIGVIAPYAKQKTKVQQLLTSKQLTDIEVSTVDGFQGREKNVIIMTCVRANMSGAVGFVGKRSRMNVALTRARYAMYLVGNVGSLESSEEWKVLIDNARKRGKIVSVDKYHFKDSLKKAILQKRK